MGPFLLFAPVLPAEWTDRATSEQLSALRVAHVRACVRAFVRACVRDGIRPSPCVRESVRPPVS